MRILFSMRHSGYIRNYQTTLTALLEAGDHVHLMFGARTKRGGPEMLEALVARYPNLTYAQTLDTTPRVIQGLRVFADLLRYYVPPCDDLPALRARVVTKLPSVLARHTVRHLHGRPDRASRLAGALGRLDRLLPPETDVLDAVRAFAPDVVLVTPYIELGGSQASFVKAARLLGVPSALCVSSWDNLTNKGTIRVPPDMVIVWNEAQRTEAATLHGIDPARVRVTGAQAYDHWFTWRPSRTRETFCLEVGLDPARPYLLYLCSSGGIAPQEVGFVREWIGALRASGNPGVRDIGVLVRPHPYNHRQWEQAELASVGQVVVWPRAGDNPVDEASKNDYFDSMHHARGIVGINTSGLIEAAVLSRPVFTLRAPMFRDTQDGTLHFRHLLREGGGLLRVAENLDEHVGHIADLVADGPATRALIAQSRAFVAAFVRPHGLDEPGTPRVVSAIREAATWQRPASRPVLPARAAGWGLQAMAQGVDALLPERRKRTDRKRQREEAPMRAGREMKLARRARTAPVPRPTSPRRLIVFTHVPKTAGSSLARMMRGSGAPIARAPNVFKGTGGVVRAPQYDRYVDALRRRPDARLLHGHTPFGAATRLADEWDLQFVTILREPVDRAVSHYYFQLQFADRRPRGGPRLSPATPLDEAFSALHLVPDNLHTRMLCGDAEPFGEVTEAMLAAACHNLETRFAAVGLVERFDETVTLFNLRLGLSMPAGPLRRVNDTRPRGADVPPDIRAAAERANQYDLALYAHACALFERSTALALTAQEA